MSMTSSAVLTASKVLNHSSRFELMSDSTLNIGYGANFAPFTYSGPGGAAGLLIDVICTALARTCFRAEFLEVNDCDVVERLADGSLDAFAVLAKTSARRRLFRFSQSLCTTGGAWFALRAQYPDRTRAPANCAVVATPGSGPLVSVIRRRFGRLSIMECRDYHSALRAVVDGMATMAALNLDVGRLQAQRDFPNLFHLPEQTFCTVSLALALPRSKASAFVRPFNAALRTLL
jgi:hypothetical protein